MGERWRESGRKVEGCGREVKESGSKVEGEWEKGGGRVGEKGRGRVGEKEMGSG